MSSRVKRRSQGITRASSSAINVISSSLVLRGLREFPHASGWRVKQAFNFSPADLAISPAGRVAFHSAAMRPSSQQIEIADLELSGPSAAIAVPDEPFIARPDFPAVFAWSPNEKQLVAASGVWQPELHLFDTHSLAFAGRFGLFRVYPAHLSWSRSGRYFAAASDSSENSKLTLWMPADSAEQFDPLCEMDRRTVIEEESSSAGGDERGSFYGFGATAFRPDERVIATVLEYDGDWSDDVLILARIPTLEIVEKFETTGHVSQLSWSSDGQRLVFCASGQVYSLDPNRGAIDSLPFAAEMCQCHPSLPLCGFYNSWLKNAAAGRIFIADMQTNAVLEECHAEEIADIRWSSDGRMFYAAASSGAAYLFDSPPF